MKKSPSKVKGWIEEAHPVWGLGGIEADVYTVLGHDTFPKKIWRLGKFSIIPPCQITFGLWELYPVNDDVERFKTLKEAKAYAESLPIKI